MALPVNRPVKVVLTSRIDLRNHRKITLIDGAITYCGNQNCADEAFAPKARFAPWVDIMLRLQGPVVSRNAADLRQRLAAGQRRRPSRPMRRSQPLPRRRASRLAIAEDHRAAPLHAATGVHADRRRAPQLGDFHAYFIPDATVLEALCAVAWRGMAVTLILPARNGFPGS